MNKNEKVNAYNRRYYDIVVKVKNPNRSAKYLRARREAMPEWNIWYRAKERAKLKGQEFKLELSDIVIPDKCPYLGIDLTTYAYRKGAPRLSSTASIDRIDSTKGYTKDNIRIISLLANTMKNNATQEQLVTFATNVLKLHNRNQNH